MALGEHVRMLLAEAGLVLHPRGDLPRPPAVPNLGEAFPRPYQQSELIEQDADYGTIVCFCERVTRGEIRDALRSSIPPRDLDGLRRRTRAMLGRCQGFYCGAEVDSMLIESVEVDPMRSGSTGQDRT
jgi:glycerol-3-phosphate dehydrogenase